MGDPYSFPGTDGKQISIKTNLYPYKFDRNLVGYYQLQVFRTEHRRPKETVKVPANSLPKYVRIFNEKLPFSGRKNMMIPGYANGENTLGVYIIPPIDGGPAESDAQVPNHDLRLTIKDHTECKRDGAPVANVRMVLEFKHLFDSNSELGDSEPSQFLKKVIMASLGNIMGKKYDVIGRHLYVTKAKSMDPIMDLDFLTRLVTGFKYRFHPDIPDISGPIGNTAVMSVNSAVNIVSRTNVSVLQYFVSTVLNYPVGEKNFRPEDFKGVMMDGKQKERLLSLLQDLDVYISCERMRGNSRIYYTVTDISEDSARNLVTHNNRDGSSCPLNVYYDRILQKEGKRIQLPDQCALFLSLKKGGPPKAVPFELVYVSDRPQRVKGNMENFRREYLKHSAVYPVRRFEMIQSFIDDLKSELRILQDESVLAKVSLKIHKDCVLVDGRVLDKPELSDEVLYAPFTSQNVDYVIIDLHSFMENEKQEYIEKSMKQLINIFRSLRISFAEEPLMKCKRDVNNINVELEVVDIVNKAKGKPGYNPNNKLFFFVIENDDENDVHAKVKRALHNNGYVSQVLKISTLDHIVGSKPRRGARYFDPVVDQPTIVATQIAMKVNAKLGGTRVNVLDSNPAWQNYLNLDNPTMFIGIDTRLPVRKDCIGRVGFVFSTDLTGTNYLAVVKNTDDVVYKYSTEMSRNLQEAIAMFTENVGRRPKNVIVYRAGMNEYDIGSSRGEAVLELGQIKEVLQNMGGDIPKVAYIGYHRAHNIRFMRTEFDPDYQNPDGNQDDELKWNLPVGTVIDQKIVNPNCFFLVTHCAVMGTTKPARYTIVCDDIPITANDLISLTYTLCSISPRCKKSIRRPLPIKLASLLLERSYELFPTADERKNRPSGREFPFHEALRTVPFYV
uniref:Piwi domain-containing protein n=1 Tax=Panagrolaimus sp. JU765 TaxID=591449 RepID=A0AC34Q5F9_9BILA